MPPFLPRKRLRSPSPLPEPPAPKDIKGKGKSTPRKPTVFDALDSASRPKRAVNQSKQLLEKLNATEDESSSLSDLSSSEPDFEDVPQPKRRKTTKAEEEDDDDEDIEFEDVQTHAEQPHAGPVVGPRHESDGEDGDLNLTLTKETRVSITNPHDKKRAPTKIERGIRIATHQMHVQFLMWHNAVRNSWICNTEVHEILLKQLGPTVEKEIIQWRRASGLEVPAAPKPTPKKGTAKGKGKPDERKSRDWGAHAQRSSTGQVDMSHGDPLFRLIKALSLFWRSRFRVTEPGLRKIGYMPLHRLDEELKSFQNDPHDPEIHGERIASLDDFKNHAKRCEGSRDLGAQFFTALLRAIGLEARMVASLQPVGFGWSAVEEAAERKDKKKPKAPKRTENVDSDEASSDEDMGDSEDDRDLKSVRTPKVVKNSKPNSAKKASRKSVRGNGAKDAPIDLSDEDIEDNESVVDVTPIRPRREQSKPYEKDLAPNYWSEVLSPVTNTWLPCSTLLADGGAATNENLLAFFEPKGKKAEKAKQVMAYLIGFSPDGTAKDVTVRYLKRHMFPGKTKGMRMPAEKVPIYNRHGKVKRYEQYDWFKTVMSGYERREKMKTDVDAHEEATDLRVVKPERKEVKEGEETLASYKASTEFILEKHMRREEALLPGTQPVKLFIAKSGKKGTEEHRVFLRKDVVKCKTMETWHKEGREPMQGEEPLKRVPYRVATLNRRRELAEAEAATGEVPLQGLYSWDQTDWIIPPPIENGVIPKNNFGNMDVYVSSMVPLGAVHIPYSGTVKVCKQLGIDYAEAVTGFEFGGRMAIPVITGVVVAEEHEELVIERWHEFEAERVRKEDEKKRIKTLGVWRKLLMGMRIMERVREEYGDQVDDNVDELNPWTNKTKEERMNAEGQRRIMEKHDEDMSGGFFPEGEGHEEEPVAQGFFPTRHESDGEDDDGGGFLVENDSSRENGVGVVSRHYHTESKGNGLQISEDDSLSLEKKNPSSISSKKSTPKNLPKSKAPIKTPRSTRNGSSKKGAKKKTATKKALPVSDGEDDMDQSSDLSPMSSLDSDSELEARPRLKSKQRVQQTSKSSPATRTMPKRQAAKRSEAALKSKYFEVSDDDDDV